MPASFKARQEQLAAKNRERQARVAANREALEQNKGNRSKTIDRASVKGLKAAAATPGGPTTSANRSNSIVPRGSMRDDYECPICLCFTAEPVVTPCKHLFCFQCSKQMTQMGSTCPLCRANFDKLFVPVVNKEF